MDFKKIKEIKLNTTTILAAVSALLLVGIIIVSVFLFNSEKEAETIMQ